MEYADCVIDDIDIVCPCGSVLWSTESGEFRLPNDSAAFVLLVQCMECHVLVRTWHHPDWSNRMSQFVPEIRARRLRRESIENDEDEDDE